MAHAPARALRCGDHLSNHWFLRLVYCRELSQENWELLQENERAGAELALMREERAALDSAYAEVGRTLDALNTV